MNTAPEKMDKCQWCGSMHGPRCPEVKALEFHENGTIRRVEYVTYGDSRVRTEEHHHYPQPRQELSDAEKDRIVRERMTRVRG